MIRYHSFYPCVLFLIDRFSIDLLSAPRWHREDAYQHLTNEKDERALAAVRAFNPYDLYSKSDDLADAATLKAYYMELINTYFPPREGETERVIKW